MVAVATDRSDTSQNHYQTHPLRCWNIGRGWWRVVALITRLIKTGVIRVKMHLCRIYAAPPPLWEKRRLWKMPQRAMSVFAISLCGSLMPARCVMQWAYLREARLVSTSPREWIPALEAAFSTSAAASMEKSRGEEETRGKNSHRFLTRLRGSKSLRANPE